MILFGVALRQAREEKGFSRGDLWMRIRAKFESPIHPDTIKHLEQHPKRVPRPHVRAQIVAILTVLR